MMIPLLPVEEAIKRGKEAGLDERFASLNAFRAMLNSPSAAAAAAGLLRALMVPEHAESPIPRARHSAYGMAFAI